MTRKPKPLTLAEFARMGGKARVAKLGPEKVRQSIVTARKAMAEKRKGMTAEEREQISAAARENARRLWAPGGALRVKHDAWKKAQKGKK